MHKIENKNSTGISVFSYENKEKHPTYISKICCKEKHVDLLLIGEGEKKHYVLFNDFNIFMYNHVEENIFVVIVYMFSLQKLRCLRKVNMLNSEILK